MASSIISAFHCGYGLVEVAGRCFGCSSLASPAYRILKGQIFGGNHRTAGDHDGPLNDIFKLPDISGIIVFDQKVLGLTAHTIDFLAVCFPKTPDEVRHQNGNILAAFFERRDFQ